MHAKNCIDSGRDKRKDSRQPGDAFFHVPLGQLLNISGERSQNDPEHFNTLNVLPAAKTVLSNNRTAGNERFDEFKFDLGLLQDVEAAEGDAVVIISFARDENCGTDNCPR